MLPKVMIKTCHYTLALLYSHTHPQRHGWGGFVAAILEYKCAHFHKGVMRESILWKAELGLGPIRRGSKGQVLSLADIRFFLLKGSSSHRWSA